MDRQEIIRMAREAGEAEGLETVIFHPVFERFANLVAAAEREACAKVVEDFDFKFQDDSVGTLQGAAEAIRARGEK